MRRWLFPILVLLAAGLFAWSDRPGTRSSLPAADGALVGEPLQLTVTTVDGRELDLDAMQGQVVLLDFWASWCGPCITQLPELKSLYDRYHAQGLEIVGISLDRSPEALQRFVAAKEIPWPQVFDESMRISAALGVGAIPTAWLIGRDGRIVSTAVGNRLETLILNELQADADSAATAVPDDAVAIPRLQESSRTQSGV